jgi:transketolase C-terminal domain/subunit
MVGRSMRAAELLAEKGIDAGVIDMPTIKPLDANLICETAAKTGQLLLRMNIP